MKRCIYIFIISGEGEPSLGSTQAQAELHSAYFHRNAGLQDQIFSAITGNLIQLTAMALFGLRTV